MLKEFGSSELLYYSLEVEATGLPWRINFALQYGVEIGVKDCLFAVSRRRT
jgi:hypothetical protein